jgi:hypothetical protein
MDVPRRVRGEKQGKTTLFPCFTGGRGRELDHPFHTSCHRALRAPAHELQRSSRVWQNVGKSMIARRGVAIVAVGLPITQVSPFSRSRCPERKPD